MKLRWCETETAGFREWSEGGIPHTRPYVNQSVCVFAEEDDASDTYQSLSLHDVAGEDWPNFDPGASAQTTPRNASELSDLAAHDWEIGCGSGDPDDLCAVWVFRACYGSALTKVEVGSGGGIGFSAMRDLIRSIDRHIAASVVIADHCPRMSGHRQGWPVFYGFSEGVLKRGPVG